MKQPFKKSFDKKEGSRKTENAPFKKEYRKKEFREDKPENKKSEFPERR